MRPAENIPLWVMTTPPLRLLEKLAPALSPRKCFYISIAACGPLKFWMWPASKLCYKCTTVEQKTLFFLKSCFTFNYVLYLWRKNRAKVFDFTVINNSAWTKMCILKAKFKVNVDRWKHCAINGCRFPTPDLQQWKAEGAWHRPPCVRLLGERELCSYIVCTFLTPQL